MIINAGWVLCSYVHVLFRTAPPIQYRTIQVNTNNWSFIEARGAATHRLIYKDERHAQLCNNTKCSTNQSQMCCLCCAKTPHQAACLRLAVALPLAEAFIRALVFKALAVTAALPFAFLGLPSLPTTVALHLATKPNFPVCCCAHWVLKPA